MVIVIGSTAISKTLLKFRTPNDTDVWSDNEDYVLEEKSKSGMDVKLIPTGILKLLTVVDGTHCSADDVYTIKCSHLGWNNPCWSKHKADVLNLKAQGCILNTKLFDVLVDYWKEEFGNKEFLSLSKTKKDFFTDNVTYVYDHDWLHIQVSAPEEPVYKQCLKDGENVLISKYKFDKLPFSSQVRMFREEIAVIAIERYLVNPAVKGRHSWFQAYSMSLQKTITQLTKGWATNFIVCNLEHFNKPDYTYFKHALSVLDD